MNNYLNIKYLRIAPVSYIAMCFCGLCSILCFISFIKQPSFVDIITTLVCLLMSYVNVLCIQINESI